MNDKIGIGVITCNRHQYFAKCIGSLFNPAYYSELVVVNDVEPHEDFEKLEKLNLATKYIQNEKNLGIGKSKNKAIKYLMDAGCEHIFILEDDIIVNDKIVFKKYIEAAKESGILHFNYGLGTPFNKKQSIQFDLHNRHELNDDGEPNPRIIVEYDNIKISFYPHICGMFSYYNRKVIESIGYIDEQFYNAWEHVDHTYQAIKKGFHPPFWWFADIYNSDEYISPQKDAIKNSVTAKNTDAWMENVQKNADKYRVKNGTYPAQTPQVSQNDFLKTLKDIKNG